MYFTASSVSIRFTDSTMRGIVTVAIAGSVASWIGETRTASPLVARTFTPTIVTAESDVAGAAGCWAGATRATHSIASAAQRKLARVMGPPDVVD